jgi:hypothetical protein
MSQIWKHYEQGRADDGMCEEPGDLRCAGGNTTALWNHLKKNHPSSGSGGSKRKAEDTPWHVKVYISMVGMV